MSSLPPFAPFFLAAALALVVGGRLRAVVLVALPILGAFNLYHLPDGTLWQLSFLSNELEPVRVDRLSRLFGYLFHIGALLGIVFALHVRDRFELVGALVYAGSALGAVFAGDLVTLFVFWELMAVSSVCLVWARRTERATRSGFRYLVIQVLSGVLLLGGAAAHALDTGALTFTYIGLEGVAGWLVFLAFGIKCAFPFLHNWLTDAYPEATPTGTVFLTAFTTKVAVYALARGFPGTEMLVWIGAAMTCFPIFYAVIENDLRRVLAYSMINQIGFMVCGIGIGTELAVNGAVAHAFNDVIFKGLLMMSMGAVLHMTGRINGSDLGGLYKSMPITTVLCIVGAASISAFPLFSGFVSKSMVMSAALSEGYHGVWLALLFASAGGVPSRGDQDPLLRVLRARLRHPDHRAARQHAGRDGDRRVPVRAHRLLPAAALRPAAVRHRLHGLRHHPRARAAPDSLLLGARVRVAQALGALPAGAAVGEHRCRVAVSAARLARGARRALRRTGGLRRVRQRRPPGRTRGRGLGATQLRSRGETRRGLGHEPDGDRDDHRAVRVPDIPLNAARPHGFTRTPPSNVAG